MASEAVRRSMRAFVRDLMLAIDVRRTGRHLATIEGMHGVDQAPAGELPALLAERFATAPVGAWVTRLTSRD